MAVPNWQDDTDDFARSIAEEARRQSEAAIGTNSGRSSRGSSDGDVFANGRDDGEFSEFTSEFGGSDRPTPSRTSSQNPLEESLSSRASRSPSDPDALARLIAQRARRESEAYIGNADGAGDRLLLYLILTPGVGMAISPWMLVRSRSTMRQRQASRFALGAGAVWLVTTLLSSSGGDGVSQWVSFGSVTTWIYVFLMLSQMVRVWQRKSLPIKR
ncbi:MAG: hypothetical protein AAGA67_04210 [Cyanobacteria bacterium P01_F01_bin.153]